jgi:hypothetical protein
MATGGMTFLPIMGRRGRDARYPTPPAQIPACGFSAPGSSMRLASALPDLGETAIPLREVGWAAPARQVRPQLPVQAASPRPPLPHGSGAPALRVLGGDPTPHGPSAARLAVGWAYLWPGLHGVAHVLDASLPAYHARQWTPTDPREARQQRFLCVGFWCVNTLAVCMSRDHGAVSSFRECGLPCGLRGALCTLHLVRSVFTSLPGATLGRSGWLDLAPQGLPPCKKPQASLGALTLAVSRGRNEPAVGRQLHCLVRARRCTAPWFFGT